MVNNNPHAIAELAARLREFAGTRDWEVFHTPKNLAMALSVEVSEIMEIFQWLTGDQSQTLTDDQRDRVTDEIGDVLIYLIRLSDQLGIDPIHAAWQKIEKNEFKYPVDKVKGKALKYTELSSSQK